MTNFASRNAEVGQTGSITKMEIEVKEMQREEEDAILEDVNF